MNRQNNFALLHLIGIFLVVLGHFLILYTGNANSVPHLMGTIIQAVGVDTLFIVSGFLVSQSIFVKNKKVGRYYIEKIIRLYPALIVCLILSILFGFLMSADKSSTYWIGSGRYLYKNILMNPTYAIPGLFTTVPYPNAINGSLWTLPIELGLYLLLPLFVYPFKKNKKLMAIIVSLTALIFLVLGVIFEVRSDLSAVFWGNDWFRAFTKCYFFFAGFLLMILVNYKEKIKQYFNVIVSLVLVIFVTAMESFGVFTIVLRYLALPYIVVSVALAKPLFYKQINKIDFIYGIYLYSFPITQSVVYISMLSGNDFTNGWVMALCFIMTIVVTMIFAAFSQYFVEKPVNKLYFYISNKLTSKKNESQSV